MTPEKHEIIENVHRVWLEIQEGKALIRRHRGVLKDVLEQNDEWRELQELLKQMTKDRRRLQAIIAGDRDVQKAESEIEELQLKQKDLREIMSHHLVRYYEMSHDTSIADPEGEYRQIILSAKIGETTDVLPGQTKIEVDDQGLHAGNVTIKKTEVPNGKRTQI